MDGVPPPAANQQPSASLKSFPPAGKSLRLWLLGLAALPAVIPILIIFRYHVQFIWADAWDFSDLLIRAHQQTLHMANFFTHHNEHRMPIPYLVMFVLAQLTRWNTIAEVIFGYAMVCVLSILLAFLLKTRDGRLHNSTGWLWSWFLLNVLIFSPIQCENWVFGFASCQNFIPIPCFVAAMLILRRKGVNWKTLLCCGVLIEIASLSSANGLMGWVLVFPLLVCPAESWEELRQRQWLLLAWIAMIAVSLIGQFAGYQRYKLATSYYTAALGGRVEFFFAFLGTPLNFGASPSIIFSAVLGIGLLTIYLSLVVWVVRRWIARDLPVVRQAMPWIMLGLFPISSAVMGAAGRVGLGVQQAGASRYTTISICLLISLVGTIPLLPMKRAKPIFSTLLLIAMAIGAFRSMDLYDEAAHEDRMGKAHLEFLNFVTEPSAHVLIGFTDSISEKADALNELGYLRPPMVTNPDISLLKPADADSDAIRLWVGSVEGAQQNPDGTIQIWGWAMLPHQRRRADVVLITCENADKKPILCAIADVRDDLSQIIGKNVGNSEWIAVFPRTRLPAGSHRIACWAYDSELREAYPLPGPAIQTSGP